MEKEIENLIEELIKVTPEMLSKKGLKLFNTIMAILNENAELKKNYINPSKARMLYCNTKKGTEVVIEGFVPKSKIKEKIEELESKIKATFCKYMTEEDYYNNKFLSSDVAEDYEVLEVRKLISNRNLLQELMEE